MTKDEALKLALEALELLQGGCTDSDDGTVEAITVWCPEVIDAIREALTQPEQEPVANGIIRTLISIDKDGIETWKHEPFYTTPPQRKPLTDEQWQEIAAITGCLRIEKRGRDAILRVLEEAAHGIKE